MITTSRFFKEKQYMWYKVRELQSKGLNKTQIGKHLGVDRSTVRRYLQMSREDFVRRREGGNLAASKIRNLECPNYEICLIDYGCGKFNRKIHIMEQYP